jgi:hypothetical protein
MTEQEWRAATDPFELLDSVEEETPQRNTRLFADACCRRIARFCAAERSRTAIEVRDRYADDLASEGELARALSEADAAGQVFAVRHAIGRIGLAAAKAVIFLTRALFVNDVILGVLQTMFATDCGATPLFTEPGWLMHTPDEIGIDAFQADRSPDGRYRTAPLGGLWTHTRGGFYHDGRFTT